MKNIFGDEVEPRKITFKWLVPILDIFIDGRWSGCISANGYLGGSMNIHHKLGEPVMNNVHLHAWVSMSFSEWQMIMEEWNKHMNPEQCMLIVLAKIAEQKNMSIEQALAYVKEKNIPLYFNGL